MSSESGDDVLLNWFESNDSGDDDEFLSQEDIGEEDEESAEEVGLESLRRVLNLYNICITFDEFMISNNDIRSL
ncbi:4635_t:CDS:2 [Paraglomus brasilianum]|uniref:4635_t:CDS:1 n=1 Tax=Paraglomus brasilianum TaxID=144538 RepID=A0A9N9A8Z4_9GLOM|nr:4635_t:CDS:2 [Paraglomus brasilianum]